MVPAWQETGLERLPMEARLAVAEALWDSVQAELDATPPTDAQRAELDRRLALAHGAAADTVPWAEIKDAALARSRR